jgi:cyclic lactone autoinducer peptide
MKWRALQMRSRRGEVISKIFLSIVAGFGMKFAAIGANSVCCFILHQPEKPELSKLRKF